MKKPLKSGATLAIGFRSALSALADGWSWVISGFALREKLSSRFERQPRLVQEGRQRPEGGLEVAIADGRRVEDDARVPDQSLQLSLALAEGAEDLAGVADELLDGALLGVEHAQHPVGVLGEGREVRDRGREVRAAPGARDGELLHPGLERRPWSSGRTS